jgi:hypothetical protein
MSRHKYPARTEFFIVDCPVLSRAPTPLWILAWQKRAEFFVRSAVELRPALFPPLNSEELVEESGVAVLVELPRLLHEGPIASKVTRADLK